MFYHRQAWRYAGTGIRYLRSLILDCPEGYIMLKAHEKIYSENGKRLILVADDEWINREILGTMLQDEYEIIYAENGQEALDQIELSRRSICSQATSAE